MDPQVNVDFLLCIFFGPTLKIYKFEKFHRFIIINLIFVDIC
jgi:hypothetical protein